MNVTVNQSGTDPGSVPPPVAVLPTLRVPRFWPAALPPQVRFSSSQHSHPFEYTPSRLEHVLLQVRVQASPGPGQLVAVVPEGSGRQSALVQHVESPMQRLPQTLSLAGQTHVLPGPEQVSPVTVQLCAVVQHSAVG